MESKTMLLDLVQQRKDGKISQEEMVRQLVQLRNSQQHDATQPTAPGESTAEATTAVTPTPGPAASIGSDRRSTIHAGIERQRQERLAERSGGTSAGFPRRAWEAAADAPSPAPGDAAALVRTFCAAVNSQGREWRELFDDYDYEGKGVLDFGSLRRGIRNDTSVAQSALTDIELERLFGMMCRGQQNSVSASEFNDFLSEVGGSQRDEHPFHSKSAALLRKKFHTAIRTGHGKPALKSILGQYDADRDGLVDFSEFVQAVRRGAKVTRSTLSDRDLQQLFETVDSGRTGKISGEELQAFLQIGQQRKHQRRDSLVAKSDASSAWDGAGSEVSDTVAMEGRFSSQSSIASTDPSFQRGQRVARKLKQQEDAKCTFTPEISELPSQYSRNKSSISDGPFEDRAGQWLSKRQQKVVAGRQVAEKKETAGCTFHPRISPATNARQRQARSGRTREAEFERLYSEKLGRDQANTRKKQPDSRNDGGQWFKPKINDSPKNLPPENYSKPVVRKVGAVTQQLLSQRECENTFAPKTNAVPAKFGCAAEYLSDNAFDRLSRPARSVGDETGDVSDGGERLFDSVYDTFGNDSDARLAQSMLRSAAAPRIRASQKRASKDSDSVSNERYFVLLQACKLAALPYKYKCVRSYDNFYEKTQRWAAKKQEKLEKKAAEVEDKTKVGSIVACRLFAFPVLTDFCTVCCLIFAVCCVRAAEIASHV